MPDHPTIVQQVTWIYSEDLKGTSRFYTDTLGLTQVFDQGLCRLLRLTQTSFLGLCQVRPGRHVEPRGVVITMVSTDQAGVDAWHDQLATAGYPADGVPERHEDFNVYCFFARDPNGYLLEFQTFLDPAWALATA